MKALMVTEEGGYFSIIGAATPESWETVQAEADSTERMYALAGWGEYTAVYKVHMAYGLDLTYFVAED